MDPLRACAWLVVALPLVGCIDERDRPTPGPACTGPNCVQMTTGGSNPTSGGGGTGGGGGSGGAEAAVLAGSVRVLNEASFEESALFTGAAKISAPQAGGGTASVDYGGAAGTSFTLEDVQAGDQWVLAEVANAGAEVFSGYSLQHVPAAAAALPVVDRAVLVDIASTITGQPTVEAGDAHIALSFEDAMKNPLEGIRVVDGSAGAVILYDGGVAGEYTDGAMATGKAGRILLLNASPPSTSVLTIAVEDASGTSFTLPIRLGPDAVTLAAFEL